MQTAGGAVTEGGDRIDRLGRLVVALDVPTHDEAVALVDTLDNVSFFKIGLELFLAGDLRALLRRLQTARGGQGSIFIDLKTAGDIGNTVARFVAGAAGMGVRLITFIEAAETAITRHTLAAGRAARGPGRFPKFLAVPLLSSLDAPDERIVARGKPMIEAGCDGLVVSGTAISACRAAFPDATLVSPGIRPAWWDARDDHVRWTTPAEAVLRGADHLVVGRPIRSAANPRDAAQRIIDEIDDAAQRRQAAAP